MKPQGPALLPGDRVQRKVWQRGASEFGTVINICRIQHWENTIRVKVHWDSCKHPAVTGIHLLKRVNMSLTDLELKKHTEPIQKELDRQKEKAAHWKQLALDWKRKAIDYATLISTKRKEIDLLLLTPGADVTPVLRTIADDMRKAVSADIVEVGALTRGDIVTALRDLDPEGANVTRGTKGVVFQPANFHEKNTGPMVRWFSGGACNVYDGDVIREDYKPKGDTK